MEGHQETGGHIYYVSSDNSMFHLQHSYITSNDYQYIQKKTTCETPDQQHGCC